LALFLVVVTVSDFRYSYRLRLTKTDVRKAGFWIGWAFGVSLLTTDVWFQNGFTVPKLISNSNNVKALLGAVFLRDGVQNYYQMPAYDRLAATVSFIRDAITLIESMP